LLSAALAICPVLPRIIEGGELEHLLAEYLNLDVRIDLAGRPRRAD
jgi:hypothetical protein